MKTKRAVRRSGGRGGRAVEGVGEEREPEKGGLKISEEMKGIRGKRKLGWKDKWEV